MTECPICRETMEDLLKHLRITHDITDAEQYQTLVDKVEKNDLRKREFGDFVREINQQRQEGSISLEQYRESREKWLKEHEEE